VCRRLAQTQSLAASAASGWGGHNRWKGRGAPRPVLGGPARVCPAPLRSGSVTSGGCGAPFASAPPPARGSRRWLLLGGVDRAQQPTPGTRRCVGWWVGWVLIAGDKVRRAPPSQSSTSSLRSVVADVRVAPGLRVGVELVWLRATHRGCPHVGSQSA